MESQKRYTKKQRTLDIIERLKKEYPNTVCTLDTSHAWQLLVSVRLAAQCTDARVNVVVQDLFAKYPGVKELAAADVSDIEAIVKPCGLGKSKARDISACMNMLVDSYNCQVPDSLDELLKLPGVGRKSANLIMGLVDGIKDPKKVEMELWKLVPPEESNDFCHRLVDHGRAVCSARTKPHCDACCLNDICKKIL